MCKQPKVSIVVPIYGVEKYLHQCVDSILAQTLKDIEIILVDDGSKDKCPEIVDEYAKKDKRIKVLHLTNGGYGRAVNRGIEVATGEYIGITEPDDWIACDMYEKLYNMAIEKKADIVKTPFYKYFDIDNISEDKRYHLCEWKFNKKPTNVFNINECPDFFYFHPSIWSAIYKTDFINSNNIRMEENPGAGWSDNLFQVQTLSLVNSIYYLDKAFYYYRNKNLDDALDLRDQTIPYLRTKTIHSWMNENNITNTDVWANLYKREIAYLHIVFRSVKLFNFKNIVPHIVDWQKGLNSEYFDGNILTKKEIKILNTINSPCKVWKYFICYKLGFVRRFVFSVKINLLGCFIQILGIQFSYNVSLNRPAFVKINL